MKKQHLPDIESFKPGDLVRIIKAYVKSDLTGAPTLNIGSGVPQSNQQNLLVLFHQ